MQFESFEFQVPALPQPITQLGVRRTGAGINVAVLASRAQRVDLCLLDPVPGGDETTPEGWTERRIQLSGPHQGVWSGHVGGINPGQRYGFRVHGAWDPARGLWHNPAKILTDPYALGMEGELTFDSVTYGYQMSEDPDDTRNPHGPADCRDSLGAVPLSVVVDDSYPTHRPEKPNVPWRDTVIYEAHVVGLTKLLPGVPEELRGSYAGLGHPATIAHLKDLGITTVELLPIHFHVSEPHLADTNLTNYWGYNTLGFFAPHLKYGSVAARAQGPSAVLRELKGAVDLLHVAGLEVVLDVVYNHTCEGGTEGQHLSWRGFDATGFYLHDADRPGSLLSVTGTGNTLDFSRWRVIQLALDSLRYWVSEVGVDGFRFDLATTLGRNREGFRRDQPFLVALQTDPVLRGAKLIAEPWDVGYGGWQTGNFPPPFAEWNDRYRNAIRSFWLADPSRASHGFAGHRVGELATRLSGSVDLFGHGEIPLSRTPTASINFITAHDGFTLADLTTYDHKHNEANGEDGRDGSNDNRSWNHGVEGPLSNGDLCGEIFSLRRRSMRNLMGTLLLSAGTPMIAAGDEFGRTQHGNNNAYCQDNEISWINWDLADWQQDLLETTKFLLRLRQENPAMRPDTFYSGSPIDGRRQALRDLVWFDACGEELTSERWADPESRTLQMLRRAPLSPDGNTVGRDSLLVINGALDPVDITLARDSHQWDLVWDSSWESPAKNSDDEAVTNGKTVIDSLTLQVYLATVNL